MSAFGTKKPGSDEAIQMGFPEVFAATYATRGGPRPQFTTSNRSDSDSDSGVGSDSDSDSDMDMNGLQLPLPVGQDVQDRYHEQKRLDANHMAMAGVQARKMSDRRAESAAHGFFGMPKPVLGQRRYANPSLGNQADIYAARYDHNPTMGSGSGSCYETQIRGGVRSAEGQTFAKKMLMNRVGQLDIIDRNKAAFLASQPTEEMPSEASISQGLPENVGKKTMLELNALLQQIADAIYGGLPSVNRYALGDLTRALSLLFRVATVANREELDDLKSLFDDLIRFNSLAHDIEQEMDEDGGHANKDMIQSGSTMLSLLDKTQQYITKMLGVVNRPPKERAKISSALVRDLKFSKLGKLGADAIASINIPSPGPPPLRVLPGEGAAGFPGAGDDDDADDDDGNEGDEAQEAAAEEDVEPFGEDAAQLGEEEGGEGEAQEGLDEAADEAEAAAPPRDGLNANQRKRLAEYEVASILAIKGKPQKRYAAMQAYARALGLETGAGISLDDLARLVKTERETHEEPVYVAFRNPDSRFDAPRWAILGLPVMDADGTYQYGAAPKFLGEANALRALAAVEAHPIEHQIYIAEGRARQFVPPRPAKLRQRDTRAATNGERTFTDLPLPAEKAQQLETVQSRGMKVRDVKYSHDERNDFARNSGAYMGEALPEGGDNVEMPSRYPILKASGMAKAMMRGTAEPMFAGGYTPSTLKKKLGGQRMTGFPAQGRLGVYNGQPEMMGSGIIDDVKEHAKKLYNMGRYAINPIATTVRDAKHLYAQRYTPYNLPKERTWGEYFSGKGKMSRANLPKTREGFVKFAEELKGHGTIIRVNSGSALKNIRQNFIRKLAL